MKTFDDAFTALIGNEGGYSYNPADPGGETMYGITKNVAVAHGYTGSMKSLPLATAKQIAKAAYWDVLSLDQLDPMVAYQVFDAGYNSGVSIAAKWLQRAVGTQPDGVIGPLTIKAVQITPPHIVVFRLLSQRLSFYTGLSTWGTFGKGWANRIANNLNIAGQS